MTSSGKNTLDFGKHITSLLSQKRVKYKVLTRNSPAPSLYTSSFDRFIFPGSRSDLMQLLLISLTSQHLLLLEVFSNSIHLPASEASSALLALLDLNPLLEHGLWHMEVHGPTIIINLAVIQYPAPAAVIPHSVLWTLFGQVDSVFKSKCKEVLRGQPPKSVQVCEELKRLMESQGFRNYTESRTDAGTDFVVVLTSVGDQRDVRPWKQFPLKIEVRDLLIFKIYFSMNDSVVSLPDWSIPKFKVLLTYITSYMTIGSFVLIEDTAQVVLMVKIDYRSLAADDLRAAIRALYEEILQLYQWTAPALVKLKVDLDGNHINFTDEWVKDYLQLIDEGLIGAENYVYLDFTADAEGTFEEQRKLIETMKNCSDLNRFLLTNPAEIVQNYKKIKVKSRRSLLPIGEFIRNCPFGRGKVLSELEELIEICKKINVFPRLDMIFCEQSVNIGIKLIFAKGIHTNLLQFLTEMCENGLNWYERETRQFSSISDCELIYISPESFESYTSIDISGIPVISATLAGENYLFHPISSNNITPETEHLLLNHQSEADRLSLSHGLVGLTELDDMSESGVLSDGETCYFLEKCRLDGQIDRITASDITKLINSAMYLHAFSLFFGFISPFSMRKPPAEASYLPISLPCFRPRYFKLLSQLIPAVMWRYIAPELVAAGGSEYSENTNLNSCDVYSVSVIMTEFISRNSGWFDGWDDLQRTVAKGTDRMPENRPKLSEIAQGWEQWTDQKG